MIMPLITIGERQQAFRTHHNYIRSLKHLMSGSTLSHTSIGRIRRASIPLLDTKRNLINLTEQSLKDEANIVQTDRDYSYASTSWLPVKTYYLLFKMMTTINYLFTLDPASFKIGHGKCSEGFTKRLARGDITFTQRKLNAVYNHTIFAHVEAPGANLRSRSGPDQHTTLAMKKIAQYNLEEWKRPKRIPKFATERDRQEKQVILTRISVIGLRISLLFALACQLSGLRLIEGGASTETAVYFNDYFAFAMDFYRTLGDLRDQLVRARVG